MFFCSNASLQNCPYHYMERCEILIRSLQRALNQLTANLIDNVPNMCILTYNSVCNRGPCHKFVSLDN
jgi:hypothetical protein